jgi:hypothetical protein
MSPIVENSSAKQEAARMDGLVDEKDHANTKKVTRDPTYFLHLDFIVLKVIFTILFNVCLHCKSLFFRLKILSSGYTLGNYWNIQSFSISCSNHLRDPLRDSAKKLPSSSMT